MNTGIVKVDQIAPDPAKDIQVVTCKNVQDLQISGLNSAQRKIQTYLREDIMNGYLI